MAQTAGLAPRRGSPRLSQLLPTVTCSSCGHPVPLAELSSHTCPPRPPPASAGREPPSSSPPKLLPSSLLPNRLHNLISRANTPPQQRSLGPAHVPPSTGLAPPNADQSQRVPPVVDRSKKKKASVDPSTSDVHPPPVDVTTTQARTHQRLRSSVASSATSRSLPRSSGVSLAAGEPVVARPEATTVEREEPQPVLKPPFPMSVPRVTTPSNGSLPSSLQPRSSSVHRTRTPTTDPSPTPNSLFTQPRPSFDRLHKSAVDNVRSFSDPRRPLAHQMPGPLSAPATAPPQLPKESSTVPFPSLPAVSFPLPSTNPQVMRPSQRLPAMMSEREIDTKCGGEAGMAGVGRRGFAAAARAAMLAAPSFTDPMIPGDGLRSNAPKFLDINTTMGHVLRAAMTPPLSPGSAYTPSPVSPVLITPVSPMANITRTPSNGGRRDVSSEEQHEPVTLHQKVQQLLKSSPRIASRSPSPPIPNPFERRVSGETITQSPMYEHNMRLPILDMLKRSDEKGDESDDESVYTTHTSDSKRDRTSASPPMDSEVGLPRTHADQDMRVIAPLDVRKLSVQTSKVEFPTMPSSDRSRSSGSIRKGSAGSTASRISSRSTNTMGSFHRSNSSTAKSGGALERAMETLIEEGASVSVLASGSVLASIAGPSYNRGAPGKPNRSNTVPGPGSPENKAPKLPMRSHTNPSHPHVHSDRVKATAEVARIRNRVVKQDRICARCESKIEGGRWIQMDGGSVLCERCWKNMYLPKCRRCNLPIEKQAVSSRDGQLKGKYHKDCFDCQTCHKPFPDKEFYVFDGKPLCAYHYHEANGSLCAAASCGQPIEGPCAVNHAGRRYHPQHLLCEHEEGCEVRLVEYWEVDGQMLCERHASVSGSRNGGSTRGEDDCSDSEEQRRDDGRARKRMTRFIDLGVADDEEPDIR